MVEISQPGMEKEDMNESSSMMTYVVGAVLLVVVVAGAWYFKSKTPASPVTEPTAQTQPVATPTPGAITGLGCDLQYMNQKIGFAEYYLSAEGGDVSGASDVTCNFVAKVDNKVVGRTSADSPLSDAPQRGGKTFRCTSEAIALEPNIPTVVEVTLTDDVDNTASCAATFTFPQP